MFLMVRKRPFKLAPRGKIEELRSGLKGFKEGSSENEKIERRSYFYLQQYITRRGDFFITGGVRF